MSIFHQTYKIKSCHYDLLTQTKPGNFIKEPQTIKVILSFSSKDPSYNKLINNLFALKLLTGLKPKILTSKKAVTSLKIRKGSPIGCSVTLREKQAEKFLFKTLFLAFPNIKTLEKLKLSKKIKNPQSFSFFIEDLLVFPELENQYELFQHQKLPKLNVTLISSATNLNKLKTILMSLKYPLKLN